MKYIRMLIGVGIIILSGCSKVSNNVIAKIGSEKIMLDEFKRRLNEIPPYYEGFLSTKWGKKQFLEGLIKEKLLLIKAKQLGIDKRHQIKERIKAFKQELLLEEIINDLKKKEIAVSDKEIMDYYNAHKEEFLHVEQLRASHILVRTKKEAEKVLEEIKNKKGAKFSSLAKKYSIDSITAAQGGDLGYFSKGEMVPEFESAVFALKNVGDITGIIKTDFGYHIAMLTGRKKLDEKTFDESKNEISSILEKNKFENLLNEYRQSTPVIVNEKLLNSIEVESDKGKSDMGEKKNEEK